MSQYYHQKNNHYEGGNHFSFGQMLLRALLSIITSIGFGLFWYALATEFNDTVWCFVVGIILILIGIIHVFLGVAKDARYRRGR